MKGHVITAHVGPEPTQQSPAQQGGAADDAVGVAPPKHIVLDAGERGRIEVGARSWADSIKERFNSSSSSGGGRKSMSQARAAAWVPPS